MSDEREETLRGGSASGTGGWREFASSALLVGAVLTILAAGFLLKTERTADPGTPSPAEAPAEILLGSTITPEVATPESAVAPTPTSAPALEPPEAPARPAAAPADPSVTADPLFEKMANRAGADLARIATARNAWTAQLLVACRLETVDRVLAASKGAATLYVLPVEVHGDACFRICWGAYKTAKDAAAAADLPKALRGKESVRAVEIAKVIR